MIDEFKLSMRSLAGAVNIITAGSGSDAAGLTATAVCSLSMTPPRLLVGINRAGSTFTALAATDEFCVNLLDTEARGLAEIFAGRTGLAGENKFADAGWICEDDHPPRLASAMAAIRCTVHSMQIVGTHAIVVGDVQSVWNRAEALPLIYHNQCFQTLQDLA